MLRRSRRVLIFSLNKEKRGEWGRGDKFNDWGGRGCNIFVPVSGGDVTIIAPTGDIFYQHPGQMQ